MTFTCPECGAVSHNTDDLLHGYCARCNAYTGADLLGDPHPCHILAPHRPHPWAPMIEDPQDSHVLHVGLALVACPGVRG